MAGRVAAESQESQGQTEPSASNTAPVSRQSGDRVRVNSTQGELTNAFPGMFDFSEAKG